MSPDSLRPNSLEITGGAKPAVPVFTCVAYIRKNEDGTVDGKVANLGGIQAKGASERFVLGKLSREFKSRVQSLFENGHEIPWIDPPEPLTASEQVRSIPIHL
ncbi:MAG: hypothetical protein ACI87E_002041 [Mariniblastus sp.]|jgi:hypothetical protein